MMGSSPPEGCGIEGRFREGGEGPRESRPTGSASRTIRFGA